MINSVGRTSLSRVLAGFGVPQNIISLIREFCDGMRACMRLDDAVCSGWFAVELGFCQRCVLSDLTFNIFSAAVINTRL